MLRPLLQVWRKWLHPFPYFPLLQTYLYSPLDRLAEREAVPAVEEAFATSRGIQAVARHFARFVDDDPSRCLRKELLCVLERRMRAVALYADPAERHGYGRVDFGGLGHPIDPVAADRLARSAGHALPAIPPRRTGGLALVSLLAWGVSLVGAGLYLWLRYGRSRVAPYEATVVAPHYMPSQVMVRLREACIAQDCWNERALLYVCDREAEFPAGAWSVAVNALPVPRAAWARQVLGPALRLTAAAWWTGLRWRRDPLAVEMATRALNLAASSLPVWRLAMNVRCRWLVDLSDYSSMHNLRALILRKWGGDLVRWPYTETEGPGLGFSYLDYGAFIAGGSYHHRTYGRSWRSDCVAVPVGLARNDQGLNDQEDVLAAREVRAAIEDRLAARQRMMVFFANNELPGFNEAALTLFAAVWPLIQARKDWFLVIKPKKTRSKGGFFDRLYGDERMRGLSAAENVLVSDFPDPASGKTTPPAWLIDRMSLGLSLPGTVQAESLTRDRPTVIFFPVIQDTPMTRVLFRHGLAFTEAADLRSAVARFMDGEPTISTPLSWARETWDPFADGMAIDRIAGFLYRDTLALPAPETAAAGVAPRAALGSQDFYRQQPFPGRSAILSRMKRPSIPQG